MPQDKEVKRSGAAAATEQRNNKKKLKDRLKKGFAISVDTALASQKEKSWPERAAVQVIEKTTVNTALISFDNIMCYNPIFLYVS